MSDASPGGGEQQGCRWSSTNSSGAQPDASAPSNADDVEPPGTPDGGTPRRARTFSDSCEWSPSFFKPPEGFGCTNLGDGSDGSDGLGCVHLVHGEAAQLTTVHEESPWSPPREGTRDVGAPLPTPHPERVPPADAEASEDEKDEPTAPCRLSLDLTLENESDGEDRDAAADAPSAAAEAAAVAADDAATDSKASPTAVHRSQANKRDAALRDAAVSALASTAV